MSSYSDIMGYVLDLRNRMRELHEREKALEEAKITLSNLSTTPMPMVKLYPSASDRDNFTLEYKYLPKIPDEIAFILEEDDNQD